MKMLKLSIIFFGTLGTSLALRSGDAGKEDRIVGGVLAYEGQFPYQLSLQYPDGFHYCGGSIVNSLYILSAAHCPILTGHYAVAGEFDMTTTSGNEQRLRILEVVNHEDYDATYMWHDIAVAKLESPLTFDDYVSAVTLPPQFENYAAGDLSTVSGWGLTAAWETNASPLLLYTNQEVVDDSTCRDAYSTIICDGDTNTYCYISPSQLCAGVPEGGKGPCDGDSGGPLVEGFYGPSSYKYAKQIGIVSGGVACTQTGLPEIYTQLSFYVDWIIDTILNDFECCCPSCGKRDDPTTCGYIECSTGQSTFEDCPDYTCFDPNTCECVPIVNCDVPCGYAVDPEDSCNYIDCQTSTPESCPVGYCFNPSSCYCEKVEGPEPPCPTCGYYEDPEGSCGYYDCNDPNSDPTFGNCPDGYCFNPNTCYCEPN